MKSPFPIKCECGRRWDEKAWSALPQAGVSFGRRGGRDRELKVCPHPCGRMLVGRSLTKSVNRTPARGGK